MLRLMLRFLLLLNICIQKWIILYNLSTIIYYQMFSYVFIF